jgi:hypothetical protein
MKKSIYTIVIVMILLFLITLAGCVSRQSPNTYSSDTFQKPQYTESSCFQFSNIEAKTLYPEHPSLSVYQVTANVKNTCMENFDHVCIKLTYYDSDNMVVTTKMYEIAPFQHGLTKGVNFILGPGTGLNQPVRQQFNAYIVNPGQGYLSCI